MKKLIWMGLETRTPNARGKTPALELHANNQQLGGQSALPLTGIQYLALNKHFKHVSANCSSLMLKWKPTHFARRNRPPSSFSHWRQSRGWLSQPLALLARRSALPVVGSPLRRVCRGSP
jgi:hypothetical protein